MKTKRIKPKYIIIVSVVVLMLILNVTARLWPSFSDFYVQKIFPIISLPMMLISNLFPFSLGEVFVIVCVAIVLLGIPTLIVIFCLRKKRKALFKKSASFALDLVLWILIFIFTTETLNCFIMYQCSTFSSRYFEETVHTEELLLETLSDVAVRVGELYDNFPRDEQGYIILQDDFAEDCIVAMKKASSNYSQLSGYYPKPKAIMNSFFMSQEGIIGLYMPFAMEATYNDDIQPIAKPSTLCHELAHLKGIIQEDEANFVSMVACFGAESDFVRYSGYLDALYYLYSDAKKLKGTEYEDAFYEAIACVPAIVWTQDIASYTADYWEKNADKEIIPTETVQAVSEALTDASLQLNGVEDGIMSYYRVVELLMDYKAAGNII